MFKAYYIRYQLFFQFPATTSRGVLYEKTSWFLVVQEDGRIGIGECAPIQGLSIDNIEKIPVVLDELCTKLILGEKINSADYVDFPSVMFAIETALLSVNSKNTFILFPSDFTSGEKGIKINGLIWAGEDDYIFSQINNKVREGFNVIKMKIGYKEFEKELEILRQTRQTYPEIDIRLDANGGFTPDVALNYLERLSELNIHSIEQPIKPNQWDELKVICKKSPIKIALDEELIGIRDNKERERLLKEVKPSYIILKPTLIGGFTECEQWIEIAEQNNVGWWVTSALESNIGLNAISQWAYIKNPTFIHGLGTGKIYSNNIPSPLYLKNNRLFYSPDGVWDIHKIIS